MSDMPTVPTPGRTRLAQARLVIFDFDGTLADSFPWFAAELNEVARRWRFRSVDDREHELLRQMSASAVLDHLGVPAWKRPMIAADMRRRMSRDIAQIGLFAGVDAMLQTLAAAGVRLGIVSSNAAGNVERVLGTRLWTLFADAECGAAVSGKHARLRRLRRHAGLKASELVYIGDEIRDIIAARRAGMAAGAVTWGYNRAAALRRYRPDLTFDQVAEIAERLIDC
jgi:phosphoglycolate phosphatase